MTDAEFRQIADAWFQSQPGKRGHDIPEGAYDQIFPVANSITQPLWGRPPTGEQLQHLYDNGLHEPQEIHAAFDDLPHPHAPSVRVGEYAGWKKAWQTYNMNVKKKSS